MILNHKFTKELLSDPICYRFPFSRICGCTIPCKIAIKEVSLNKITEGIYIGPIQQAYKKEELLQANITHIINLSNMDYFTYDNFTYLNISVMDNKYSDISTYFDTTNEFINSCLKNNSNKNILVHCYAGKSRSPTIIIAYLIKYQKMTLNECYDLLNKKVEFLSINSGFMDQLKRYESELK